MHFLPIPSMITSVQQGILVQICTSVSDAKEGDFVENSCQQVDIKKI